MSNELKKRAIVALFSIGGWYFAKAHDTKDTSPAVIIGGLIGWAAADVIVEEKTPNQVTN